MDENYNVASVANDVCSHPSKEYLDISRELLYHYTLWSSYYLELQTQLLNLQEMPDLNQMRYHEVADSMNSVEVETNQNIETHSYIPGTRADINWAGYYCAQFNWGKKIITFYRHPCDDFKCTRATTNIMGR